MAAELFSIHSVTPETLKIRKVSEALKDGAVILYPTDTGFTLGCELSHKNAIERLRQIRGIDNGKALTFLCDSLSNISEFAKVDNRAYRVLKGLVPGPYTFILPASKNVPKLAQNPKRQTAGIRVPKNGLSQLFLKEVGHPIISISAKSLGDESTNTPEELVETYRKLVDVVVTCDNYKFTGESTVLDMTGDDYTIIRKGAGYKKVIEFLGEE